MQQNIKASNRKTPLYWMLFFLLTIVLLNALILHYSEPREIVISQKQAFEIGQKLLKNESVGNSNRLILWNETDTVPLLGIGRFTWYPAGFEHSVKESFPKLLQYISQTRELPAWLLAEKSLPWKSKDNYVTDKHGSFAIRLNTFLLDTLGEQTLFLIQDLEERLPDLLKKIKNPFAREKVRENFYRVANYKNGVYLLLDYVNFIKHAESNTKQHENSLGLGNVLDHMKGKSEYPVQEFLDAANFLLARHLQDSPKNETQWMSGWHRRLQTYVE